MNEAQVYAALTEVFHDVFDDETIALAPTMTAADIEGWDSTAHVALIVAAETRFGVRFRTSEFETLRNVGDFVRLIATKVAKG